MKRYRFENKKFIETMAEDATLYCFSYSELKAHQAHPPFNADAGPIVDGTQTKALKHYFKEEVHYLFLADKILSAEQDTYIGHYRDYTLLSLTLIDHEDETKNEQIVMIIYEDYSLLFYDDTFWF